jgi:DNA-binding MarR family transcriptional regulator
MTRIVNSLEEGGYVSRRAHESDRRQVVVALTEQGRTTLLADRDRRDAWLACRLEDLSAQERDLLRRAAPLLERLATSD